MLFVIQPSIQGDTKIHYVVGMLDVFIDPGDFSSLCLSVVQVENTSLCSWVAGSAVVRNVDQCFFSKLVFQFLKCVGLCCDGNVVRIDETSGVGCDRLVICVDVEKYWSKNTSLEDTIFLISPPAFVPIQVNVEATICQECF